MNKIILISCFILPLLTNVLGQGFELSHLKKLEDIGKKLEESISKQCVAHIDSELGVCKKELQDKYMNKIQKLAQDIAMAGQQGDTNKVAELGKQISNPLCCGLYFIEDCMTNAIVKVDFEKIT